MALLQPQIHIHYTFPYGTKYSIDVCSLWQRIQQYFAYIGIYGSIQLASPACQCILSVCGRVPFSVSTPLALPPYHISQLVVASIGRFLNIFIWDDSQFPQSALTYMCAVQYHSHRFDGNSFEIELFKFIVFGAHDSAHMEKCVCIFVCVKCIRMFVSTYFSILGIRCNCLKINEINTIIHGKWSFIQ